MQVVQGGGMAAHRPACGSETHVGWVQPTCVDSGRVGEVSQALGTDKQLSLGGLLAVTSIGALLASARDGRQW